ncbi:subtilisin-like protease SBT4.11 [Silene latifolia]|uniref:subtilisin-like protease SBT4.11 n=1 Tax=Silene latifolia TaxID=37657 RepID=UPI003D781C43
MGSIPDNDQYSPSAHHVSLLQQVQKTKTSISGSLIRTYTKSFNGFSAKLTNEEKEAIQGMEGVVSVFPNKKLKLHTTRSWDFMGFTENVKRNLDVESDVIVGIFDTGIWPESESFNDDGLGPIPEKWKGVCDGGFNFTCNKKIIGARFYTDDKTARDHDGHGTHTASTVAGMLVRKASLDGIAEGTARGAVPSARIAVYKVCGEIDCFADDVLAAFDDAIADGVDILSLSLGHSGLASDLVDDFFALGSFHAMDKNILTVHAAGNDGKFGITTSVAPWLLTVAASKMDRHIVNKLVVDDVMPFLSTSINRYTSSNLPVLYGEDLVTPDCDIDNAKICNLADCLNNSILESNIIMCDKSYGLGINGNDSERLSRVPVAGLIYPEITGDDSSSQSSVTDALIPEVDFEVLKNYKANKRSIKATIHKSTEIKAQVITVASFSSRGPNTILPEIMKPDVTAPGVEVLAATPNGYEILSGTSMSCPHVAGAAAYVKSFHPHWSPSAIKSALMTTAWSLDTDYAANQEAEFAFGSGHIDPILAVDPGLVYNISKTDYVTLLYRIGYNATKVSMITGKPAYEPVSNSTRLPPRDFNYPALVSVVKPFRQFKIWFQRKVTNVGDPNSVYNITVPYVSEKDVTVTVSPSVLRFNPVKKAKYFKVKVAGEAVWRRLTAELVLSDGTHNVRSPIVIHTSLSALSLSSRI